MGRKTPVFRVGRSYDIDVSKDGQFLAHINYVINVWDIPNRVQVGRFNDLKHPSDCTISNSGRELLVKSTSGQMALYDLTNMSLVRLLRPSACEGANPFFSADDQFLIDGDWEGNILVVDKCTGEVVFRRQYQNCMVHTIDRLKTADTYLFSVSPKYGWTAPEGSNWDGNFVLVEWQYPFEQNDPLELVTGYGRLWAARYSPTGQFVAVVSGHTDELVVLDRDVRTVRGSAPLKRGKDVAWSRDGHMLAVVGDGIVHFYEFPGLTAVHSIQLPYACAAKFSDDGESVLLGSWRSGHHIPVSTIGTIEELR